MAQYFRIITDAWRLMKEYSAYDGSDATANSLFQKMEALNKKYNNHPFMQDLLCAILKELERKKNDA